MIKTFLITYDLKEIGRSPRDFSKFYDKIKEIGTWKHPIESTWIIKTENLIARDIYDRLKPLINDTDSIFIVEITNSDKSGWLGKSFWQWCGCSK